MRALAEALQRAFGDQAIGLAAVLVSLRRRWKDLVGPMMAMHSEPVRIEAGQKGEVLVVAVSHAAIGGQLRMLQRMLLRECRRLTGRTLVRLRTEVCPQAGAHAAPQRVYPISLRKRKEIAKALACVRDRELKRALYRAWCAQLRYRK